MSEQQQTQYGHIKWFNADRGFGFINSDGRNFFFHVTGCLMPKAQVECGLAVAFEISTAPDGKERATHVRLQVE